jgi:hypothetical protein
MVFFYLPNEVRPRVSGELQYWAWILCIPDEYAVTLVYGTNLDAIAVKGTS